MKLTLIFRWLIFVAVGLAAVQSGAEQTLLLKTQKEKQSYAAGVELFRNFQRQGVELDPELIAKGIKDAQAGGTLLMNEKDLKTTLDGFSAQLRWKKAANRLMDGQENKKKGEAFLAENKAKADVVTLPSGLQYKILKAGEGRKPTEADSVGCRIRGTHIDGTEFENSGANPRTLKVAAVISGWREALKLMSVGSKWQLFIPAQLAYGQQGSGPIGTQETLIYEIELLHVR
jgi:UDP-GlcNAc:undecaprenyl-phosphate/decaprenyl-phosphate GlcNAc-1-phosphate transferase